MLLTSRTNHEDGSIWVLTQFVSLPISLLEDPPRVSCKDKEGVVHEYSIVDPISQHLYCDDYCETLALNEILLRGKEKGYNLLVSCTNLDMMRKEDDFIRTQIPDKCKLESYV